MRTKILIANMYRNAFYVVNAFGAELDYSVASLRTNPEKCLHRILLWENSCMLTTVKNTEKQQSTLVVAVYKDG